MASTYRTNTAGNPYQFVGSHLLGSNIQPLAQRFTDLTGAPATPRFIAAVGNILDKVQEDISDATSDSDDDSKLNRLPHNPSGSDTILTSEDGLNKAQKMIEDNTAKNNDGSPQSQDQTASESAFLKATLNSILGSNDPAQTMQQAAKKPFYEDSNFYTTLLMMAVAAASGSSPIQTLQMAMAMRHRGKARDYLNTNMATLKANYDPVSIEEALESGDLGKLKQKQLSPTQQMELNAALEDFKYRRQRSDQLADRDYAAAQKTQDQQTQLLGKALSESGGGVNTVLSAIMQEESGGNPNVKGNGGGLFQMEPAALKDSGYKGTQAQFAKEPPMVQEAIASNYLNQLQAHYNGDMNKAVAAYNAGQGTVDNAIKQGGENWANFLPGSENYNGPIKENTVKYLSDIRNFVQTHTKSTGSSSKSNPYEGMTANYNGKTIQAVGAPMGTGKNAVIDAVDSQGNKMLVPASTFVSGGAPSEDKPLSDKQITSINTLSNSPGITSYFNKLDTRIAGIQSAQSSLDRLNEIMNDSNLTEDEKAKEASGLKDELESQLASIRQGGFASVSNDAAREIEHASGLINRMQQEMQNADNGLPSASTLKSINNQFNQMKKSDESAMNNFIQHQKDMIDQMDGLDPRVKKDVKLKLDMKNVAYETETGPTAPTSSTPQAQANTSVAAARAQGAIGTAPAGTKPGWHTSRDGRRVWVQDGYVYLTKPTK